MENERIAYGVQKTLLTLITAAGLFFFFYYAGLLSGFGFQHGGQISIGSFSFSTDALQWYFIVTLCVVGAIFTLYGVLAAASHTALLHPALKIALGIGAFIFIYVDTVDSRNLARRAAAEAEHKASEPMENAERNTNMLAKAEAKAKCSNGDTVIILRTHEQYPERDVLYLYAIHSDLQLRHEYLAEANGASSIGPGNAVVADYRKKSGAESLQCEGAEHPSPEAMLKQLKRHHANERKRMPDPELSVDLSTEAGSSIKIYHPGEHIQIKVRAHYKLPSAKGTLDTHVTYMNGFVESDSKEKVKWGSRALDKPKGSEEFQFNVDVPNLQYKRSYVQVSSRLDGHTTSKAQSGNASAEFYIPVYPHIDCQNQAQYQAWASEPAGSYNLFTLFLAYTQDCSNKGKWTQWPSDWIPGVLTDNWDQLDSINFRINDEPGYKQFIYRNIESSTDKRALEDLSTKARQECPTKLKALCRDLGSRADKALRAMKQSRARG